MLEQKATVKIKISAFLIAGLVKLLHSTLRWEEQGYIAKNTPHWSEGEPVLLAFWHAEQLMMPWAYLSKKANPRLQRPILALTSQHRDGLFAAEILRNFNLGRVAGSSSRGGGRALIEMRKLLKSGNHIAITPDGPKGPPHKVKHGVVKLASISGVKILPVSIKAQSAWVFRSWDKMFLPKPFSKVILNSLPAYSVPPDLSSEQLEVEAKKLTDLLNSMQSRTTSNQLQ